MTHRTQVLGVFGMELISGHHFFLAGLAQGDPAQMTAPSSEPTWAHRVCFPLFSALPLALVMRLGAVIRFA